MAPQKAAQLEAFKAIGEDLKHTYTLTYRPELSDNDAWRHIEVQVLGNDAKDYKITARTGYRPSRHFAD